MEHILFNIVQQKSVDLNFSIKELRKFPTHSNYLVEASQLTVINKFSPDKTLDKEKYIRFMIRKLKKKYNAYSVEVGTLQEQIP